MNDWRLFSKGQSTKEINSTMGIVQWILFRIRYRFPFDFIFQGPLM